MSSISPDLGGDIKIDQHSFLTLPVSYEDLHLSRAARNFWLSFHPKGSVKSKKAHWALNGRSVWQRAQGKDHVHMEAGPLWQRVVRTNKTWGLEASVLNFVPSQEVTFEIMMVEVKNISKKSLSFTATSAIPLFGRSADNLRDHRHVTSLLHRLNKEPYGLSLRPTMTFNERGHLINNTTYYVLGADGRGHSPVGLFPTQAAFMGESGDLERPLALVEDKKAFKNISEADQGKEAMGALQFKPVTLKAGEKTSFVLLLGIEKDPRKKLPVVPIPETVYQWLDNTKAYWNEKLGTIGFETGDPQFNSWIRWVQCQPILRKLFGCSFLPDFDYGRGGRGWRDLWQDCLALLLQNPEEVREDIVHNFGGVRVDGSNATIIGRLQVAGKWKPEFIADRNNIARTWMDHGVWPFLTTLLYLNQTGDWNILRETVPYFRDALTHRGKRVDASWRIDSSRPKEQGSLLEHILIQTLVQFFNVGEHNMIRLEDADWNDGLDMAHARGESVAFTNLYGGNLAALADLLQTLADNASWTEVKVAQELKLLLDRLENRVDYERAHEKKNRLENYFQTVARGLSGKQASLPISELARDLREKADWIRQKINQQEWVEENGHAWYNGYYDNKGNRVEGKNTKGQVRMTLSGQVYPIMAGTADQGRIQSVVKAVDKYLFDSKLGGVRLNTDFGCIQPELGRAFSFAFGEKENGAVFSHMAVMYANALYQRNFVKEGHFVFSSLFKMAQNSQRSRIFPGLPEYFNNEGRGRYMYLTGSASWYVLTLLTQVFGVRGLKGDLLLAPKLTPEQFDKRGRAAVSVRFAGSEVRVEYVNPTKKSFDKMKIRDVRSDGELVEYFRLSDREVVIKRDVVSRKAQWNFEVVLE
ncbi:MAG: hypothetical protein KCHDKBKB_01182 [Elusimicrobia bacterium]|nr:hypothetical protein [Elusimicrobiota bacterium]